MAAAGTVLHIEPVAVSTRLDELGLDEEIVRDAVLFGVQHALDCTRHDPPNLGGILSWGKTVRRLRDVLVPRKWTADNSRNYPTVVHPEKTMALAVAGGDEATGIPDSNPSTRSTKGPVTVEAVVANQLSFSDLLEDLADADDAMSLFTHQTWLVLHHIDEEADEVRVEVSLPAGVTSEGYVAAWHERIILASIPLHQEPVTESTEEPIDIPVERRTN